MLSSADRDLVQRDPALPGLRTLLDPEAFIAELTGVLSETSTAQVDMYYLRYKPGTNCLAKFRMALNGETIWGYAKTYGGNISSKFTKACQRPTVLTSLGPGRVLLVDSAIEVVFFPNDSKLETLQQLIDDGKRPEVLQALVPDAPQLWQGTLTSLSYKPERRFVARLDVDGEPCAVVKLYADRDFQDARNTAEAVQSAGVLQLPDRLGSSGHYQMVILEWLPGQPLHQFMTGPSVDRSVVRNVGAALAELHNQPGKGLEKQKPKQIREKMRLATASIRFTSPPLEDLATDIDERLGRLITSEQPELRAIHGDFYADQVLSDGDYVSIIDLDNTVRGNPASDLGLFIAHLEQNALFEGRLKAPVASVQQALIEGYQTVRETPNEIEINLHTAAGLIQLAPHHFRNREPDWQQRTELTLRRAMEIFESLPVHSAKAAHQPLPLGAPR
ncbi:hypothetical protein BH23CHL1_BH23CHL1_20660 [soil metagenome]